MANEKRNPILSALQAVFDALSPLSPAERGKVLSSVASLLEVPTLSPPQDRAATTRPEPLEGGARRAISQPAEERRRLAPIELMQEKQPHTNAQKITLFAYYRDRYEGVSRFSREDLKDYFPLVKEKPPSNYSRDFVEAVKKGWIHEASENSYITSKGVEVVEAGFPQEARSTAAPRKARTRTKSKSSRSGSRPKQRSAGKRVVLGGPKKSSQVRKA